MILAEYEAHLPAGEQESPAEFKQKNTAGCRLYASPSRTQSKSLLGKTQKLEHIRVFDDIGRILRQLPLLGQSPHFVFVALNAKRSYRELSYRLFNSARLQLLRAASIS